MIWNQNIECMDREQLREIQSIRLRKMADYVYHNSPFYRRKFQEMGLEPGDIKDIDDIVKLPFTNQLSFRTGCSSNEPDCPYPCFFRNNGQASCRTSHTQGLGYVDGEHLTCLYILWGNER